MCVMVSTYLRFVVAHWSICNFVTADPLRTLLLPNEQRFFGVRNSPSGMARDDWMADLSGFGRTEGGNVANGSVGTADRGERRY
jgi:hypothetical protein